MNDINEKIVTAWLEASTDLGIALIAPYCVGRIGQGIMLCETYVRDFGSPTGAVVITARSRQHTRPTLLIHHQWHSELGNDYSQYNRLLFTDTLNGAFYMQSRQGIEK
jgi:hypothetical protein